MTQAPSAQARAELLRPGPVHCPVHWVRQGLTVADRVLDATLRLAGDPARLDAQHTSAAKVAAETAILVRVARRCSDVAAQADRLAGRLLPIVTDRRVRLGAALHPAAALDHAAGYLALRERGADPVLDDVLRAALGHRGAAGRERVPHRELEQRWLDGLLAGEQLICAIDLERTVLGAELDLLCWTRDDAYAFTHAVMYATDFGRHPHTVPAALVPSLLAQAEAVVAGAIDDEDWDLAAEALMTWPMLAADAGPAATAALDVVLAMAEAVGTLPSATLGTTSLAGLDEQGRVDTILLSAYHTTYVMALLCALLPRCSWRRAASEGLTLTEAWYVDSAGVPAFLDLPCAAASGAASLADAARARRLVRAHRYTDLAGLYVGRPGPVAAQVTELLERVALAFAD